MLTVELTKKWMELFYDEIDKNKAYLSELDTPIGDGDHGNNMKRGVTGVKEGLAKLKEPDLKATLQAIAMALISKVGGASGPLYGTAFLEMAKKCNETQKPEELFTVALEGIKKRGGAKEGDKTMVDVWAPIVKTFSDGSFSKEEIKKAVESTKDMEARKGRASYLGERSIGHLDPGAMSSGYLFETFIDAGGTK
ncbi:dihydroxyacetone kinase subunit DhaL [Liquorilactobacillus oeni]|nr:dihydroxyacetone kinase subunit DhaL [Liquorilactobacillus oeni]